MILTFKCEGWSEDFKVGKHQTIGDVLKIIDENTQFKINLEQTKYVLSRRLNEKINVRKTFKEANIYNGDLLRMDGK